MYDLRSAKLGVSAMRKSALLLSTIVTLLCAPHVASAQEVVRVAWIKALVSGPLMIAREKGYFKQAGLDVEFELAGTAANLMPMLATNRLQVLEGGLQANIFGAIAQGLPIVIASDRASAPTGHYLLIRPELQGVVKTIADLKGRSVAAGATGSIFYYEMDRLLNSAGLSLKDVDMKTVGITQLGAGFRNGAVDAGLAYTPFTHLLPAQKLAVQMLAVDEVIKQITTAVTMINTDWAKQKPESVKSFFLALSRGVRDFCQAYHHGANRAEVQAILIRTEVVDDPELFKFFWGSRRASGEVDVDSVVDVYNWYVKAGSVAGGLPREKLVDNSFVRAANAQLGPFAIENKADRTPGCE
jgi:NitT/TauT family transport system substrate-binding protein